MTKNFLLVDPFFIKSPFEFLKNVRNRKTFDPHAFFTFSHAFLKLLKKSTITFFPFLFDLYGSLLWCQLFFGTIYCPSKLPAVNNLAQLLQACCIHTSALFEKSVEQKGHTHSAIEISHFVQMTWIPDSYPFFYVGRLQKPGYHHCNDNNRYFYYLSSSIFVSLSLAAAFLFEVL